MSGGAVGVMSADAVGANVADDGLGVDVSSANENGVSSVGWAGAGWPV